MTNMSRLIYSVHSALVWPLTVTLLVEGCAAKKLLEYPTQTLSPPPYSQVQDGLAVTIEPLTNSQESENIFGTDLLSRGIFAVYVSAENQEAPSTFILLKERFVLQAGQSTEHTVSGREQVKSGSLDAIQAATHTVGLAATVASALFFGLGGVPFAIAAGKMSSHEEGVKHKFTTEELQPKTISTGEKTLGFVYFHLPPEHRGPGPWTLHLEAQDLSSGEVIAYDFAFDWK